MHIRFACPKCNQLLGVSARKVGSRVSCPKCASEVAVPAEADAAAAAATPRFEHPEIEEAISRLAVFDRPAEEARVDRIAAPAQDNALDDTKLLISRRVVYLQAATLGFVAITFFAAGWWIGGSTSPSGRQSAAPATDPAVLDVLLHYTDAENREQPDEGAAVLVLPADLRLTDKLSATPIDPAQPEPSAASPLRHKIQTLGGAYGRTNREGRLAGLNLSAPGRYVVLLLSNHQQRAGEARPQDLATLGTYLDGAAELLANRDYRLRQETVTGRTAIVHTFGPP